MAIASVRTKLSLDRWAAILGIHPLHFNQVQYTPQRRSTAVCDAGLLQYDWQASDQVSREQIARAILQAEERIEAYTQFHLAPVWDTEEWQMTGRPYQRELVNYGGRAIPMFRSSVESTWKHFISGGVSALTFIQTATIVWSDEDNDGVDETGTVTVPVGSGQASCEIEAFYPGHQGDERYQIRSALVTVSGTTATITFKRWHAVVEALLEALDPRPALFDATVEADADYLEEVDVYRHWNDPSTQVTLMWEPWGTCFSCDGDGCPDCAYAVQTGCLYLRSTPRLGQIAWTAGDWDSDIEGFVPTGLQLGRSPDHVRMFYYSGLTSKTGCPNEMSENWAQAVAHLSLTFLDRPACQCTSDVWDYWRSMPTDLGKSIAAVERIANPFGPMLGAMDAWQRVLEPGTAILRSGTIV